MINFIKKIPEQYKSVIDKITKTAYENNYTAYAVGGFVRDMILGRNPKDLDIMVEGDNAGIKFAVLLSQKLNIHPPVVFEKFATAKLMIDNHEIEFIMPRKEYYEKNSRNPGTAKATLEQDALRRDFTVNALFLRLNDMKLLDLTGNGLKDIKKKIIRVTDETASDLIFEQDPLRILRAVRQSLQLGFSIDDKTYKSMKKKARRIKIVSPERIRDEINKILMFDKPSKAFFMFDKINLLSEIFPELKELQNIKYSPKKTFFEHTMEVVDRIPRDLLLRTSALFYNVCCSKTQKNGMQTVNNMLLKLKYSSDFKKQVLALIKTYIYVKEIKTFDDTDLRCFEKEMRESVGQAELLCKAADINYDTAVFKRIKILRKNGLLAPEKELFDGNELIETFNMPAGKWLGQAKKYLQNLQFEDPCISKKKALKKLKEYIEQSK